LAAEVPEEAARQVLGLKVTTPYSAPLPAQAGDSARKAERQQPAGRVALAVAVAAPAPVVVAIRQALTLLKAIMAAQARLITQLTALVVAAEALRKQEPALQIRQLLPVVTAETAPHHPSLAVQLPTLAAAAGLVIVVVRILLEQAALVAAETELVLDQPGAAAQSTQVVAVVDRHM
jgi:hypothetical protein